MPRESMSSPSFPQVQGDDIRRMRLSGARLQVPLGWGQGLGRGRQALPPCILCPPPSLPAPFRSSGILRTSCQPKWPNWNFRQLFAPFPPAGISFSCFSELAHEKLEDGPDLVKEMHRWVARGRHGDGLCEVRARYAPWFFAPAFQIYNAFENYF